jgi:hypothetical protein
MQKILFYKLLISVLIICTRDTFEEEKEAPGVLFDFEVTAGEGGTISNTWGSFKLGSTDTNNAINLMVEKF